MPTLILLRHGQSEWNATNQFTGWHDCDLTELGQAEAREGARLLADAGILPDVVHTSVLTRAGSPRARPDTRSSPLASQRTSLR